MMDDIQTIIFLQSQINMSALPAIKGSSSPFIQHRKSLGHSNKRHLTDINEDPLQTFQQQLQHIINNRRNNRNNKLKMNKLLSDSRKRDFQMVKLEVDDVKKRLAFQQQTRDVYNKFNDLKDQLVMKTIKTAQQQVSPRMFNSVTYSNQPPRIPIYLYNQYPPQFLPPNHYCCEMDQSRYDDHFHPKKKKNQRKYDRLQRKNRNIRKLRKYFFSVCFTVFLKNLSKRIMKKRKQIFDKFWPTKFQQQTLKLKKWFAQGSKKFFVLMLKKEDTELTVYEDDYKQVKIQKIQTLKTLIKTLYRGFQSTLNHHHFQKLIEVLHIFCKHGAYIENGVLTRQEIQSVCISQTHGYIRADHNLQKVNIINFIFLKIILFNVILQPWKLDNVNFSQQKKTLKNNFYFVGSILYRIFLTIRESYLSTEKNRVYKIGNWQQTGLHFKCSHPLIYPKTKHEENQFISGLIDDIELLKLFEKDIWKTQRQFFTNLIEKMHENLVQYHKKFIIEQVEHKTFVTQFHNSQQ